MICRSALISVHLELQRRDVFPLKLAVCCRSTLEMEREEHSHLEDTPLGSCCLGVMAEQKGVDVGMPFIIAKHWSYCESICVCRKVTAAVTSDIYPRMVVNHSNLIVHVGEEEGDD